MWQRFTERARRVILLAQEEALKMDTANVGTEHLLLGLTREGDGAGAKILQQMDISEADVRLKIRSTGEYAEEFPLAHAEPKRDWLGRERPPIAPEPRLTPQSKRVLELAADEAPRMRHNTIGTEHLLLALARQEDSMAARILSEMGVDLERARLQVLQHLGPATPQEPPAAPEAEKWEQPSDKIIVRVLGQILEGDSMALKILVASGLDAEAARERVQKFIDENP